MGQAASQSRAPSCACGNRISDDILKSFSVIIPTLNESATIAAALHSVRSAAVPPLEVLVVDGGSSDDTAHTARRLGAQVLHSQRGRGRQLDVGWRAARGEWCLFLHSDSQLPEEYDRHLAAAMRASAAEWEGRGRRWAAPAAMCARRRPIAPAGAESAGGWTRGAPAASGRGGGAGPGAGGAAGAGGVVHGRGEGASPEAACCRPARTAGAGPSSAAAAAGTTSGTECAGRGRGSRPGPCCAGAAGSVTSAESCTSGASNARRPAAPSWLGPPRPGGGAWAARRAAAAGAAAGCAAGGGARCSCSPTWGAFATIHTDLKSPLLRGALSAAVELRTRLLLRPYGDQALFVRRDVLEAHGGFGELPLLEDLELVIRLGKERRPAIVAAPVRTSARRWQAVGFLRTTLLNQAILLAYAAGVPPRTLALWYNSARGAAIQRDASGASAPC